MSVHPRFDYSGQPFALPSPAFLTRSWRLKHNVLGSAGRASSVLAASATEPGEDSIYVAQLQGGLPVYMGYNYGTFNNWAALVRRFGGHAYLISITPVVQNSVPSMLLDIEPGNATPADAYRFQAQRNHGGASKPMFYMSAGDTQAVINNLSSHGYDRSDYFLVSAHWIGRHICAPSVCGYPQADATQWAANNEFDSDLFYAYMFAPPDPHPELQLTNPITIDPVNGVNAVHTLQDRLDIWADSLLHTNARVRSDGEFGPLTEAAVKSFQAAVKIKEDGIVGPVTWAHLLQSPPKAAPFTAKGTRNVAVTYQITVERDIPGYHGLYDTVVSGTADGKPWSYSAPAAPSSFTVKVPGPGKYTVKSSAKGWLTGTETVEVPAS